MSQVKVLKAGSLVLWALAVVTALSCSGTERPQAAFTSVGRGAPVSPAIPWEMWRNPDDIEAIPPQEITRLPATALAGRSA